MVSYSQVMVLAAAMFLVAARILTAVNESAWQQLSPQEQQVILAEHAETARKAKLIDETWGGDIAEWWENGRMFVVFGKSGRIAREDCSGAFSVDLSTFPNRVGKVYKYGTPEWDVAALKFLKQQMHRD